MSLHTTVNLSIFYSGLLMLKSFSKMYYRERVLLLKQALPISPNAWRIYGFRIIICDYCYPRWTSEKTSLRDCHLSCGLENEGTFPT